MKKTAAIIAIIIIVITLHTVFGILNYPNTFLISKMSFINSFFYKSAVRIKILHENLGNFNQTSLENQKLKTQIENLTMQIAQLRFFEEENQTLKNNLNFLRGTEFNYLSGRIFNKSEDKINKILVIDKGTNEGVKRGLPVINEGGVLIGVIDEATSAYSQIKLLSDNLSQISVKIQNESKSQGLLRGGFDLGTRIELVPQGETVEEGDVVVSSGLDQNIPPGLLIGYVESVRSNPHEPFQTVFIKSATDYGKMTVATILIVD